MSLDRRQFLVQAAIGASGALSLVVFGCGRGGVAIDLNQVYGDPADALAIGRGYLMQFPDESDRETLIGLTIAAADTATPERLRRTLHDEIRADFAAARLFVADHWMLSRTEGRLAALAALDVD